jgi:hypothetical protein
MAPFAANDTEDDPRLFIAATRANTLDPHGKRKGVALNVAMGTEHCVLDIIDASVPSQFDNSVIKVI